MVHVIQTACPPSAPPAPLPVLPPLPLPPAPSPVPQTPVPHWAPSQSHSPSLPPGQVPPGQLPGARLLSLHISDIAALISLISHSNTQTPWAMESVWSWQREPNPAVPEEYNSPTREVISSQNTAAKPGTEFRRAEISPAIFSTAPSAAARSPCTSSAGSAWAFFLAGPSTSTTSTLESCTGESPHAPLRWTHHSFACPGSVHTACFSRHSLQLLVREPLDQTQSYTNYVRLRTLENTRVFYLPTPLSCTARTTPRLRPSAPTPHAPLSGAPPPPLSIPPCRQWWPVEWWAAPPQFLHARHPASSVCTVSARRCSAASSALWRRDSSSVCFWAASSSMRFRASSSAHLRASSSTLWCSSSSLHHHRSSFCLANVAICLSKLSSLSGMAMTDY